MKYTTVKVLLFCLITAFQNLNGQVTDGSDDANLSIYNNFDFIAGKKVVFFDDFTSGLKKWKIIEFDKSDDVESPGIKNITNDNFSWLKTPRKGIIYPIGVKSLADEFTLEFDMWADIEKMSEMEGGLNIVIVNNKVKKDEYSAPFDNNPQIQIDIHPSEELLYCIAIRENGDHERELAKKQIKNGWNIGKPHRISISRNKSHIKVYVNEKKFIDLADGLPKEGAYTLLLNTNLWGDGLYFTNFKISEGLVDDTPKLDNEGKFVTNSIYFNVNSASIKPESWSALNQAATLIKSVNGKIMIIGHTDSDGADDANLILSQKRAESVKQELIKNFNIEANKLLTDGKGESVPLDKNDSAEGKANNRRVEFVLIK